MNCLLFKSRIWPFLRQAFIPLLAVILLGGHAYGQTPVRVMPLGDSITGSPGCWRALLWNQLQNDGYTNLDFVGSLPAQGCGVSHDGDNEGHGGILATNMADANQLVSWLDSSHPDIVLMHLGTNDVWSNRPTETILAAFSTLVEQMRAHNPAIKILVAQIIPMDSAQSCSSCAQGVINLNNALPSWAASLSTSASPITVVDQWTAFSTSSHTYDGVHPNSAGDQLIADNWFDALSNLLDSGVAPPDNFPPTACFTGSTHLVIGATGNFDASCSTDPENDALSYSWSFGDGTTATGLMTEHVYNQSGSFSVTLTVNDGQGNSDISTALVSVRSIASSSSSSSPAGQECNWYGTLYPLCATTESGWGWENNQSCIASFTCSSQPTPYGIVGDIPSSASSVSSSSSVASSTSADGSSNSSVDDSSNSSDDHSSSSTSSSDADPQGNCEYLVSNEWSNGFTGAIRITNNGTSAINGWSVNWSYSDGSTITNAWNATITGNNPYTASNISWNGSIQPGQSVEFGFQGTKTGETASKPQITGTPCQ